MMDYILTPKFMFMCLLEQFPIINILEELVIELDAAGNKYTFRSCIVRILATTNRILAQN